MVEYTIALHSLWTYNLYPNQNFTFLKRTWSIIIVYLTVSKHGDG